MQQTIRHPWHGVPLPADADLLELPVVIEIPQGSKNKYELDKETGLLKLDRVLFSSVHYPHNYGFVPRTLADDGDALDALVIGQEPVAPLTLVTGRVIGGFRMRDEAGEDVKIVCVHRNDPSCAHYRKLEELPQHVVVEMMNFFEQYKQLENKRVDVGDRIDTEEALRVVRESVRCYRERFARQG